MVEEETRGALSRRGCGTGGVEGNVSGHQRRGGGSER